MVDFEWVYPRHSSLETSERTVKNVTAPTSHGDDSEESENGEDMVLGLVQQGRPLQKSFRLLDHLFLRLLQDLQELFNFVQELRKPFIFSCMIQ